MGKDFVEVTMNKAPRPENQLNFIDKLVLLLLAGFPVLLTVGILVSSLTPELGKNIAVAGVVSLILGLLVGSLFLRRPKPPWD